MLSDTQHFLNHIWQQQVHFTAQAFPLIKHMISGDDLAGIACEELAESRIISGYGLNDQWQCQQGPFTAEDFAALDHKHWTLLVQGVDQWIDDIYRLFDSFDFLPRWRLEDIMASYAPLGGGVGPHFDYYDVFLIQVSGQREWKIGETCNAHTPLQNNDQVKLLKTFNTQTSYQANTGDMLYIPAGVAHWGTASSDDCITLSVGFRAPSEKEIISTALDNIIDILPENQRYQDNSTSIADNPHYINASAHQQLHRIALQLTPDKLNQALQQAFGQLVTEARHPPLEENLALENDDIDKIFNAEKKITLSHPPHSRLAFSEAQLFVNGEAYDCDVTFSTQVCAGNIITTPSKDQLALLKQLIARGDTTLA